MARGVAMWRIGSCREVFKLLLLDDLDSPTLRLFLLTLVFKCEILHIAWQFSDWTSNEVVTGRSQKREEGTHIAGHRRSVLVPRHPAEHRCEKRQECVSASPKRITKDASLQDFELITARETGWHRPSRDDHKSTTRGELSQNLKT